MKSVCVYCGSSYGKLADYHESASTLAEELVKQNITLVYGGASVGIMGKIADAVIDRGGKVIGVIPRSLAEKEIAHQGLSELRIVDSMHQRKSIMAEISQGFIALPGGLGTIEELFEVLTWSQLGLHQKPCALLNVKHYYDHLLSFLDHAVEQEFVKVAHRKILLVDNEPGKLLQRMADFTAVKSEKWIH